MGSIIIFIDVLNLCGKFLITIFILLIIVNWVLNNTIIIIRIVISSPLYADSWLIKQLFSGFNYNPNVNSHSGLVYAEYGFPVSWLMSVIFHILNIMPKTIY